MVTTVSRTLGRTILIIPTFDHASNNGGEGGSPNSQGSPHIHRYLGLGSQGPQNFMTRLQPKILFQTEQSLGLEQISK